MTRRDFKGAGGSGTGGCGERAARAPKSFSILSPAMAPLELHLHRSHDGARLAGLSPKNSSGGSVSKEVSAGEVSARKWVKEYSLLPLPTDHDNFGLNGDAGGKPVPTSPHPAFVNASPERRPPCHGNTFEQIVKVT